MNPSIVSGLVACGLSILFACLAAAVGQAAPAKHEPNSGPVADADAAKEVAKAVLSRLLTPEDLKRKEFLVRYVERGRLDCALQGAKDPRIGANRDSDSAGIRSSHQVRRPKCLAPCDAPHPSASFPGLCNGLKNFAIRLTHYPDIRTSVKRRNVSGRRRSV